MKEGKQEGWRERECDEIVEARSRDTTLTMVHEKLVIGTIETEMNANAVARPKNI